MPAMPHVHAFGRPWLATGLLLACCWLTVTGKAQLQRHQRGHSAQQCGAVKAAWKAKILPIITSAARHTHLLHCARRLGVLLRC